MNTASLERLKTCHPDLVKLMLSVDEVYPIHVVCGERSKEDQQRAFHEGNSKVQYPNSKHSVGKEAGRDLSDAVDIVPDPDRNPKTLSWTNLDAFQVMLFAVEAMAKKHNIKIRLGRDFKFRDYPHIERVT